MLHAVVMVVNLLFSVPEGEGNVLQTVGVADTSNAVFTPSEGS